VEAAVGSRSVEVVVECGGLRGPCAAGCDLETAIFLLYSKGGRAYVRDGASMR